MKYITVANSHVAGGDLGFYITAVNHVKISNILFLHGIPSSGNYTAVRADRVSWLTVADCTVQGNNGSQGTENAVWVTSAQGSPSQFNVINDNNFTSLGASPSIIIDGGSTNYCVISGNQIGSPRVRSSSRMGPRQLRTWFSETTTTAAAAR